MPVRLFWSDALGWVTVPGADDSDGEPVKHLCGHLPLHESPETATTYCIKCAAWGCTTANCPGHQRWPDQAEA